MIHPGYFGLAVTVMAIVFSAGGFYVGTRVRGANNKNEHILMLAEIKNLDAVKMSRSVCTERHTWIETTLKRMERKMDLAIKANGHDNQ